MTNIEKRVQKKIEERNTGVENNKAWETSLTRRALLILFTYLAVSLYLFAIGVAHPWQSGIVPAAGFMISTLTIPYFKRLWLKHRK